MTDGWAERIDTFWASADAGRPEAMLAAMRDLVEERPSADPQALYEWASVHDFLGREAEAVPLYQQALELGLTGPSRPRALIQLASSLRNLGDAAGAVSLLAPLGSNEVTGSAAHAFLALALHDLGRHDEALRAALLALAPTLPLFQRSVERYANELVDRS